MRTKTPMRSDLLWDVASLFSLFGVSMPKGRSSSSRFHRDLHGPGTSTFVYHSFKACVHLCFSLKTPAFR